MLLHLFCFEQWDQCYIVKRYYDVAKTRTPVFDPAAYATDVARKEFGLRGIKQTSDGHLEKDEVSKEEETKWKNNNKRTMIFTPSESSKLFNFPRSFTPTEILSIIDRNREVLAKYYKSWFSTDSNEYKLVIKNLQTMQGKICKLSLYELFVWFLSRCVWV